MRWLIKKSPLFNTTHWTRRHQHNQIVSTYIETTKLWIKLFKHHTQYHTTRFTHIKINMNLRWVWSSIKKKAYASYCTHMYTPAQIYFQVLTMLDDISATRHSISGKSRNRMRFIDCIENAHQTFWKTFDFHLTSDNWLVNCVCVCWKLQTI